MTNSGSLWGLKACAVCALCTLVGVHLVHDVCVCALTHKEVACIHTMSGIIFSLTDVALTPKHTRVLFESLPVMLR